MLRDECDSLRRQIFCGRLRSGKMGQRLANASKDADASIDDLNCHAAHANEVRQDTFRNTSVTLAKRLLTFSLEEFAT